MARRERRAQDLAARRLEKKRLREARATPPLELLERARQRHADGWTAASEELARDGALAWMAGLLDGARAGAGEGRALAVGTGAAAAAGVLVERGWRVVGIDENPAALRAARERWAGTLLLRGHASETGAGAYAVTYDAPASPGGPGATWIEGDLVGDPALGAALAGGGPFDAVACWLLDGHDARLQCAPVRDAGIRTADEYRLGMERMVYLLADKLLRPDGVLHVVDRGPGEVDEGRAAGLLRVRDAMARGTSLELLALDTRGALVSVRSRRAAARR